MEMASVGHSLAQVPQLVQRSLAVGKGPVQPCLYGRLPGKVSDLKCVFLFIFSKMATPSEASSLASASSGRPVAYSRQMLCSAMAATAATT